MAKYTDGDFYRAVCVKVSDSEAKVRFIDYGSDNTVDLKNIAPLQSSLLLPACSHTVDVKLASKRSIVEIDAHETRGLLSDKNEFFVAIEKSEKGYSIILEDSLVAFRV